jgi:signal transduction histidine kinase
MLSSVENYHKQDEQSKLLVSATIISSMISRYMYINDASISDFPSRELEIRSAENMYRILVFNETSRVIKDTNQAYIGNIILIDEVIYALEHRDTVTINDQERAIYAASAILNSDSERVGVVLLVSSIEDIYIQMAEIRQMVFWLTLITVLALIILVFFLADYLISPLKNILKVVTKVSEGHLNQRIELKGNDEFSQVAEAFNNMTQKLEQVEKTREDFVSNVSHELKTPISSIKVLTESILLEKEVPNSTYVEFLQDINSEIDRMTYIVTDLLNLVKLDQRSIPIKLKETQINALVEDVLKRLHPLAEQKKIELVYEPVRNVSVDADDMKLSLAISNLVENGIKYTPENGTVKVTVDSDHKSAFITVQDTGVGIDEKHHQKIFDRFYRVDKMRDRETGGTGLGLSITHATIMLHNGSIKVVSKVDEGTTFKVRIPIRHIDKKEV